MNHIAGCQATSVSQNIGDRRKYRRFRPEIWENIGDLDLKYKRNIGDLT